jgi:hypothetical protein
MTCDQQRFERDVAQHEMTIVRDDGVDRHIKFREPGNSCYWFEILTWPGALCIRGDCGTYVFSRLTDMFEFFRTDAQYGKDPAKLHINASYWTEKLIAADSNGRHGGSVMDFDEERFRATVLEWANDAKDSFGDPDDFMRAVENGILYYVCDNEQESIRVAMDFQYDGRNPFCEIYDGNYQQYGFHILWNLYAIAWAIRKYDAAKATQPVEAA